MKVGYLKKLLFLYPIKFEYIEQDKLKFENNLIYFYAKFTEDLPPL
jgi:hypothetical protein